MFRTMNGIKKKKKLKIKHVSFVGVFLSEMNVKHTTGSCSRTIHCIFDFH